jgi:hypothetical protein
LLPRAWKTNHNVVHDHWVHATDAYQASNTQAFAIQGVGISVAVATTIHQQCERADVDMSCAGRLQSTACATHDIRSSTAPGTSLRDSSADRQHSMFCATCTKYSAQSRNEATGCHCLTARLSK